MDGSESEKLGYSSVVYEECITKITVLREALEEEENKLFNIIQHQQEDILDMLEYDVG